MKKSDVIAIIVLLGLIQVAIFLAVFTWKDKRVNTEKRTVEPVSRDEDLARQG